MDECSASAVFAALYSLTNPRPTEATRMTPMITASLPWPRNADASAVTASSSSSGERSWLRSTGHARARYERTAFGPATRSRRAASPAGRPPVPAPSRARTSSPPSVAAWATGTDDGTVAPSLWSETATAIRYLPVPLTACPHPRVPAPGPRREESHGPRGPASRGARRADAPKEASSMRRGTLRANVADARPAARADDVWPCPGTPPGARMPPS